MKKSLELFIARWSAHARSVRTVKELSVQIAALCQATESLDASVQNLTRTLKENNLMLGVLNETLETSETL